MWPTGKQLGGMAFGDCGEQALYEWAVNYCGKVKTAGCWFSSARTSAAEVTMSLSHSTQRFSSNTWNSLFISAIKKELCTGCKGFRKGPWRWSWVWEASHMRKDAERTVFVPPWGKKTWERPYHQYVKGAWKDGDSLFIRSHVEKMRVMSKGYPWGDADWMQEE